MRTHFLEAGEIDRPALVLVHGAGQGGRMWRRQLGALSDGFHVVAPDLPGFGGTPGPFSLTAAVESVTEIARELRCGARKVIAAGGSLRTELSAVAGILHG